MIVGHDDQRTACNSGFSVSLDGDLYLSAQASRSIDVRVTWRISTPLVDDNAQVSVRLVVRNNGSLPVRVTGAMLTTFYRGYELGSADLARASTRLNLVDSLIIHEEVVLTQKDNSIVGIVTNVDIGKVLEIMKP